MKNLITEPIGVESAYNQVPDWRDEGISNAEELLAPYKKYKPNRSTWTPKEIAEYNRMQYGGH